MKKYNKYKKKSFNPYIVFLFVFIGICIMSVGYAISIDTLSINGFSNAKYQTYYINYELYGGTNPENPATEFTIIDTVVLPIPTKTGYIFKGWYDNNEFIGAPIYTTEGLKEDIELFAYWKRNITSEVSFEMPGSHEFDGTNYINTNIYLYSEENVNKNFIISFNIDEVASTNLNHSALMNSMNEAGAPWPGHVVKVSKNNSTQYVKFESNSNTNGEGNKNIPSTVKNVRIFRINNYMYISLDGDYLVKVNDYNGFTDTFDIPVTFGADVDVNGNAFRFFTGKLSDLYVAILGSDVSVDDFNPVKQNMITAYEHLEPYEFNGTSDYIDTGLTLFDSQNFYKDFVISFEIDSIGNEYVNQATIVNAKNEKIKTYPGFVYRIYLDNKTIRFEAKMGTGSGVSNRVSEVKKVKISRKDSIMYLSINDGETKKVYDYTNFTSFFDVPITIGASLDSNGNPFRFFQGTLSNIIIKVEP